MRAQLVFMLFWFVRDVVVLLMVLGSLLGDLFLYLAARFHWIKPRCASKVARGNI